MLLHPRLGSGPGGTRVLVEDIVCALSSLMTTLEISLVG